MPGWQGGQSALPALRCSVTPAAQRPLGADSLCFYPQIMPFSEQNQALRTES